MALLGDKSVGSVVKIKDSSTAGNYVNYIIVQKGKPSSIYDNSCDGVWLLREQSVGTRRANDTANNNYENSEIHKWLNNSFINWIDPEIQAQIKTVKIPYKKGTGNSTDPVQTGSSGLSCKIFLLSVNEVGFLTDPYNDASFPNDGSKLSYFLSGDSTEADKKRQCTDQLNGGTHSWWLRSPLIIDDVYNSYNYWAVYFNGTIDAQRADDSDDITTRPVFVLPRTLFVNDDGSVTTNAPPTAPTSITVPNTVLAGTGLTVSWGTATDPEGSLAGYKLERSADGGAWTQVYSGADLKYTDTAAETGVTALQYRVKAYDIAGAESEYKTSGSVTVNPNNPPTFSAPESELGEQAGAFSLNYTITATTEGATITAVEKIDNTVKRSYNPESGVEQTFSVSDYEFLTMKNGEHTASVTASDQYGANSSFVCNFTKNETQIEFMRSEPMSADAQPERIKATLNYVAPVGAEVKVYACNNGFDVAPNWEDITEKVLNKDKYLFKNTVKTAEKWGVNVKVVIKRNGAVGDCYVSGIGGNFD